MNPEQATPANTPTSRPALDALWLDRLQQKGLSPFPSDTPTPSHAFTLSLQQLNQGVYFEAHESLEDLWDEAPYPIKLFYYALIKLAVGLLQVERRNAKAAIGQLVPALQYLAPFTPTFLALQTDKVLSQARDRLAIMEGSPSNVEAALEGLPRFRFPMRAPKRKDS